ncbi:MAG: GAF domain-containing protein, partial [Chloroflexota bacterium]
MVSLFDTVQRLTDTINRAPSPELAAQPVVNWLSEHVGSVVVGLMPPGATDPHLITDPNNPPDALVLAWIRTDTDWQNLSRGGETQGKNAVVIPLSQNGTTYGVMWQSFASAQHADNAQDTVLMLAGMLTTRLHHLGAIESDDEISEVVDTLALQTARLSAATSVSKVIIAHKDTDAMLYAVTEIICHRFGYSAVQVLMLTEDKQSLAVEVAYTENGPIEEIRGSAMSLGVKSLAGWAVQNDEQVLAGDVTTHPMYNSHNDIPGVASQLALPLRSGTQMLGALVVSSRERFGFDETDVEMMQSIADQLAVGLYNSRLFNEVRARAQDLAALTEI